jgi:hypothetical protein
VLSTKFEDTNPYFGMDSYRYLVFSDAIALRVELTQAEALQAVQGKYVSVSGRVPEERTTFVSDSVCIEEISHVGLAGPNDPRPVGTWLGVN